MPIVLIETADHRIAVRPDKSPFVQTPRCAPHARAIPDKQLDAIAALVTECIDAAVAGRFA